METRNLCIVGHEMGQLTNITYPYPRGSHHGAATRKRGYRLNSIWEEYSDDYGVFGVSSENCCDYSPLNNAPSNWSTVDIDQLYSRESPSKPWVSERI